MKLLRDPAGTVSGWGLRFLILTDDDGCVAAFSDESEALAYVALMGRKVVQAS